MPYRPGASGPFGGGYFNNNGGFYGDGPAGDGPPHDGPPGGGPPGAGQPPTGGLPTAGGSGPPGGGGNDPGTTAVSAGDGTLYVKTKPQITLSLPPLPNVNTLREWMIGIRRKVATATDFHDEAYQWINAATNHNTAPEELRATVPKTCDLNMKLAAELLAKAITCRAQGEKSA